MPARELAGRFLREPEPSIVVKANFDPVPKIVVAHGPASVVPPPR
jgi:hypothetical protein